MTVSRRWRVSGLHSDSVESWLDHCEIGRGVRSYSWLGTDQQSNCTLDTSLYQMSALHSSSSFSTPISICLISRLSRIYKDIFQSGKILKIKSKFDPILCVPWHKLFFVISTFLTLRHFTNKESYLNVSIPTLSWHWKSHNIAGHINTKEYT